MLSSSSNNISVTDWARRRLLWTTAHRVICPIEKDFLDGLPLGSPPCNMHFSLAEYLTKSTVRYL